MFGIFRGDYAVLVDRRAAAWPAEFPVVRARDARGRRIPLLLLRPSLTPSRLNQRSGFTDRAVYVLLLPPFVPFVRQIAAADCGANVRLGSSLRERVQSIALGVARFAWIALRRGGEDSPTEAMLRDWPFLLNLAAWGMAVLAIIYL